METAQSYPAINIEDEMRQSYMDYAMSVIIGRALPDVRDGLKPVQRRVLYAMLGKGLYHNRKHSKCAGVVGEVLGRLHPHGDIPAYEALVRLAQPWSLRVPLVDGQGNFGSIDGDPPAAYRYTECRMTAAAEKLLEDLDKETVDFINNFDDSDREPVVLPAAIPNLLVNGSGGIAVGMATHIPPHNLREVVQAALALIENPKLSPLDLMKYIPGPDFPTGGVIHGRSAIRAAYATGRGIIKVRGRAHVEQIKIKSREGEAIVITEIPFQVNKARLIEKIAELVNGKQVEGVSRLRDETDRKGMRIVIELKRDATAEVVLNQLYKHTPLQSSFGITNLAIVEGKPTICTLADLLNHYLDHRRDVVVRRTQYELRKALERMHLLEGFRIALLNIDDVVQLIKGSDSPQTARDGLILKYELTEIQAQAILDLRLQKLTGMERLAIEKEHEELAAEISRLRGILEDSRKVDAIIATELREVGEKFGDERRTEIVEDQVEIDVEDLIEDEEMVVSISHQGYAKRVPVTEYREQRRGGKGVKGTSSKGDDFIEHLFVASTLADLLVFTSAGRLYWLKVYHLPEAARTARGRALVNLLEVNPGEVITAVLPVAKFVEEHSVVMATREGYIKKTNLMEYSRSRKAGIIACRLEGDDTLIGVSVCHGKDDIILATKDGMAIRFSEDDVRVMGRNTRGVRGIRLVGDDRVVSMTVVAPSGTQGGNGEERVCADDTLLTVCENGYGKRTRLSDYRIQSRGGKGLIDIQTNERNGSVVRAFAASDDCGVMLITSAGKIVRTSSAGISVIGRNTQGVRLINLDEGETVAAVAHLAESEENGDSSNADSGEGE